MVVPSSDARGAGVACLVFALLLHPHGVEGRGVQLMAIGALSTCEKKNPQVSQVIQSNFKLLFVCLLTLKMLC